MIILNGGSYWPISKNTDKYLIDSIDKRDKVLFIPAASTKSQKSYFDFFKEKMIHLGLMNIDWADLYMDWKSKIDGVKAIYIAGGNTYKIMDILRKSGFGEYLQNISEDKIIMGNSAGAVVLGSDIRTSNDSNNLELIEFRDKL